MLYKALLIITALAVVVSGHSTTAPCATPSISPCVLKCITLAAKQNDCGGPTFADLDLKCVCTNAQFYADAGLCLHRHCSVDEQATAVALKNATCASAGLTAAATATPTPRPVPFSSDEASSASMRR